MGVLRISSLMFMVAKILAARIPLCVLPPGQTGLPTGSTENCLCSVGSSTIINDLDPNNAGVERLVIYIYRKSDTGDIIAFTPHTQLQHQIPDFPEEYGTVNLISDHQSIMEVFDSSPSKEIRKTRPEKSVFPGQKYAPHPERNPNNKRVKPVAVDNRLNLIHGLTQDHSYKNVKYPTWLIPVVKPHLEEAPESNDYRPGEFPQEHIEHYEYKPEHSDSDYLDYVAPKGSYKETNSHKEAVFEKPVVSELPLDFYDSPTNPYPHNDAQNSDEDYLEHPASGENEPNRDIKDISESTDSHSQVYPFGPKDTHESNDYILLDGKERDSISSSNIVPNSKIIRVPRKDNRGRIIGWQIIKTYWGGKTHHNLVRPEVSATPYHIDMSGINDDRDGKFPKKAPFWPGMHPNSVTHRVIKVNPITYHKGISHLSDDYHEQVPSFDYWLEHQLNITTVNGNKLPAKDIIALHTAIRNTLLQNGLIVTKRGTLVDGHGMVSSLDNLKLRPIIMGKSISFDRFIRNVHSDINFTIPPNSPFLEGLLLTMIKPPKILGIVPLSRASVSHKLSQKHGGDVPTNWQSYPSSTRPSLKVLPISHLVSFRKDLSKRQRLAKVKHHSVTKTSKMDHSQESDSTKHGLKEDGVEGRYSGKPTEGLSEEVPDFRIIGGMSATVSGTPLLNRGRTGREYEYADETFTSRNDHSPIAEQFSSRYGRVIEEDDGETL